LSNELGASAPHHADRHQSGGALRYVRNDAGFVEIGAMTR
jgi:hypothetical protein